MHYFRFTIIMLLGLAVAGCMPQHDGQTPPAANYYPLAIGDRWTYRYDSGKEYNADITGTKIIDGILTFAYAIGNDFSYMAVRPDGIYQYAQGQPENPQDAVIFSPPQKIYVLPLQVGNSWTTPCLLDPENPKSLVVSVYGVVQSIDTVSVPAGKFKNCIQVMIDDPRDAPANETHIWFAPNIGIVQTQTTISRSGGLAPKVYFTKLVNYKIGT